MMIMMVTMLMSMMIMSLMMMIIMNTMIMNDDDNDDDIFIILYGVFAVYFAGVMVRLMLVLAPVMCILGGIAVSSSLSTYMKYLDKDKTSQHVSDGKLSTGGKQSRNKPDMTEHSQKEGIAWFFVLMMTFFLFTYTFHCTWVTSEAYSSPSIVLSARSHDGSRIIFETND